MRIGLDLSSATPTRTGIGTYTFELARHLVRSTAHEWVLLFNSLRQPPPDTAEFHAPHVRLLTTRIPGPLLLKGWQYFDRPDISSLARGPVDLFHSPAGFVPAQHKGLRVTTIHDLYFLQSNARRAPLGGGYLKWVVEKRLRSMHLVLTDAPSVARQVEELLRRSGVPEESAPKMQAVPLAVGQDWFKAPTAQALEEVRRDYRLPDRYLLHVGGSDPRKNVPRLLEAFQCLGDASWTLVIAGAGGIKSQERVLALPYLPAESLKALYHAASALVLPSLHEGFGFPVLEAMACGTPVVAGRQVAVLEYLPEDSVLRCDAADAESIRSALHEITSDAGRRSDLASAGPGLAGRFTWEETARRTLQAYESAAAPSS